MNLFSNFITLEQSLQNASLKQKTIAQNVANADTPNYKAKKVVFQNELNRAIDAYRTDDRHFLFKRSVSGNSIVKQSTNTMYHHNGNNVDIDFEMAEMAKNQIYYNALIERINGKFNSLSTVIRGGK